jgi:hypothetical protein
MNMVDFDAKRNAWTLSTGLVIVGAVAMIAIGGAYSALGGFAQQLATHAVQRFARPLGRHSPHVGGPKC